jgi:hypothetical protein
MVLFDTGESIRIKDTRAVSTYTIMTQNSPSHLKMQQKRLGSTLVEESGGFTFSVMKHVFTSTADIRSMKQGSSRQLASPGRRRRS